MSELFCINLKHIRSSHISVWHSVCLALVLKYKKEIAPKTYCKNMHEKQTNMEIKCLDVAKRKNTDRFGRPYSFTSPAVFWRINKHVWLKQRFDHGKGPCCFGLIKVCKGFSPQISIFKTTGNSSQTISSLCTFLLFMSYCYLFIFLTYFTVWGKKKKKFFSQ